MAETQQTQPQAARPLLSEEESRLRTALYMQLRLQRQEEYYTRRIDEFEFNADRMLWLSAILMGVSTVVSSSSIVINNVALPFITALLPAFAALVAGFRAAYQWERQAAIYHGAWLGLQQARLALPDSDSMHRGDYKRYFPDLVRQTEEVLRAEATQWGQLINVVPADDGSSYLEQETDKQ